MTFANLPAAVAAVEDLAQRFRTAGHRLFLVGGIVRDQWLDHAVDGSADIDLTTDARPEQTRTIVEPVAEALWTQGERFGTIGLRHRGRAIEITTHRAESYPSDSRKPAVAFGDRIEDDLARRDFTVNAMAVELPEGTLIDPWGGAGDLAAGLLRTPLGPELSFTDDPLRMLRAARFAARFNLTPSPDLVEAASQMRDRLHIVAIERIGDEIERLLRLDDPTIGLQLLVHTGLLAVLVEWDGAPLDDAERARLDAAATLPARLDADWPARLAVLLGAIHRDGERVDDTVRRLRLSRDDRRRIGRLARAALDLDSIAAADRPTVRRWAWGHGDHDTSLAVAALLVDPGAVDRFQAAYQALMIDEAGADALLGGDEIMGLLGAGPGPHIGQAIALLTERRLDEGPLAAEAQRRIVLRWWADQRTNT